MCESSPFASYHMAQPAWANTYSDFPNSPFGSPSVSPKTSLPQCPPQARRRGAIALPMPDHLDHLSQLRKGSISTCFNNMHIQSTEQPHSLPIPTIKTPAPERYYQTVLSPPSSPRSQPAQIPAALCVPEVILGEPAEEVPAPSCRRFQRQILSRLQVLNQQYGNEDQPRQEDDQFTPPPSPGPSPYTQSPSLPPPPPPPPPSRPVSRRSSPKRRSAKAPVPVGCAVTPPTGGRGRRVSVPVNSCSAGSLSAHTSSRGAVKKVVSAASSRRGSSVAVSGRGMEILLEGTLFKSGWSWDTAYGKGGAMC